MLADPVADILAARARARQLRDPYVDVCFFATVSRDGYPEVRAIALRDIGREGFGLLINEKSPKWEQVTEHRQCSLHLFWATVQRQYRLRGLLEPMAAEPLRQYWNRKGHASRLLEYYYETVEPQSRPIASRKVLVDGFDALKQCYPTAQQIPPADSLRGVHFVPTHIDAWHGSPDDRLHDRRLFTRIETGWSYEVLVP